MIVSYYRPKRLSRKRLDSYLAAGWFRSSNGLFRAKSIFLDGSLCTVVNIRLDIPRFIPSKTQRRILKKNSAFRVDISPLQVCDQMEELYLSAKSRFKGFVFHDLSYFLNDVEESNPFDSWHVKVYDGERLVSASVFDCGENSLMSVLGLYHEDYRSFSPGIYTMLKEIEFGARMGYKRYYPGFILEENPYFDYKLGLGRFAFLKENQRWVNHREQASMSALNPVIRRKTADLETALEENGIRFKKKIYKYYPVAYVNPGMSFYRFPLVYDLGKAGKDKSRMATFDHERSMFRLDIVSNLEEPWFFAEDNDRINENNAVNYLLSVEKHVFAAAELDDFIRVIRSQNGKTAAISQTG